MKMGNTEAEEAEFKARIGSQLVDSGEGGGGGAYSKANGSHVSDLCR